MKKNNRGFMLAETLVVTTIVAASLIYLYVQFMNLSTKYNESYNYNTVEGLYALNDVVELIKDDAYAYDYISNYLVENKYIDISNCSLFSDEATCRKLFEYEKIQNILITTNTVPKSYIVDYPKNFMEFIKKIEPASIEPYRVIASFDNDTYATIRFGD